MQEILEQLIELQKIDSKIASIEGVIKNTPSQIKEIGRASCRERV